MGYNPPVRQWYDVVDDDGSHYGWLDTYLQPATNGHHWAFHYRVGEKTTPPNMSTMNPIDGSPTDFESGIDFPGGEGGEEKAKIVYPEEMPPDAPEGAVGYIEWPGQPRRWLIPA